MENPNRYSIDVMEETKDLPVYPRPIPARYNPYGEWRPLLYLGDIDALDKKVRSMVTEDTDHRITGCLKYMLATGFPVIEFIVKGNFSTTYSDSGVSHDIGHLHMRKIEVVNLENNTEANLQVYDCSLEIPEITIKAIEEGLDLINIFLYRLAYGINAKYDWFLKYPHSSRGGGGMINLTDEDTRIAEDYVRKFQGDDSVLLDNVISWYQEGNRLSNENPLLSFLSYYFALEKLALNLHDGEMEASKDYGFQKAEKKFVKDFFNKILGKLFHKEIGNYSKTKKVLEAVLGKESNAFKAFKKKIKGKSGKEYVLYDLRSNIAHGRFTPLEKEEIELITKNLYKLQSLTRKFISKVLWKGDANNIKETFSISLMMADPRSTGITNDINLVNRHDWRIKLEWLY